MIYGFSVVQDASLHARLLEVVVPLRLKLVNTTS